MRKHVFLVGQAMVIGGLLGCGENRLTESNVRHTMDEPVRTPSKFQWQTLDQNEFEKVFLPFQGFALNQRQIALVDPSEPVSQRLQEWVDHFDKNLRTSHPEETKNVPKPTVIVKAEANPNAFVMAMPTCVNLRVRLKTTARENQSLKTVMITANGQVVTGPPENFCIKRKFSDEEAQEFVDWLNGEMATCRVKLEISGELREIVPQQSCSFNLATRAAHHADQLVYLPTPNYLTVHTGMFKLMDELPFASVLAHELGHYYRSHSTAAREDKDYNFFYKLGQENSDRRPVADQSLRKLGEEVRRMHLPTLKYSRIKDQTFRSELFNAITLLPGAVFYLDGADEQHDNAKCADFAAWMRDEDVAGELDQFPYRSLSKDEAKLYAELETRAKECLKTIEISDDEGASQKGEAMGAELVLRSLVIDRQLIPWFEDFRPEGNLLSALEEATQLIDDKFAESKKVLDKAESLNLGFYTVEQEADELSAEWLADVGEDPLHVTKADLILTRLKDERRLLAGADLYPHTMTHERCQRLIENDWKDEDGKYFFVPIADFVDPHHSGCYRVFNITREIAAHKLSANTTVERFESQVSASWKDIQEQVDEIEKDLEEELDGPIDFFAAGSSKIQMDFLNEVFPASCSYFGND